MKAEVRLRFYEELNDHLPPERRKVCFSHACADGATVGVVLAEMGVPATEVDLVLVNGSTAGLDHRLRNGDRLSVFPVFESLDITPAGPLHGRPLRDLRFIVDRRLGTLATALRMLGFDTLCQGDAEDAQLAVISQDQQRILLARDRRLLRHPGVSRGYRVAAANPRDQVEEVLDRFDLAGAVKPFSRCLDCNTPLEDPEDARPLSRAGRGTRFGHERLLVCPDCGRAYRKGEAVDAKVPGNEPDTEGP